MKKYKLVLGSASPRRKELLSQLKIPFDLVLPSGEEDMECKDPQEFVSALSLKKNHEVEKKISVHTRPLAVIITADTTVYWKGSFLEKPKDREDARRMLVQLRGSSHDVYTGVCLSYEENSHRQFDNFYEKTQVRFGNFSDDFLEFYLNTQSWKDKAGGYGIQDAGQVMVDSFEGNYSNIVGFPLGPVYSHLKNLATRKGYSSLWEMF